MDKKRWDQLTREQKDAENERGREWRKNLPAERMEKRRDIDRKRQARVVRRKNMRNAVMTRLANGATVSQIMAEYELNYDDVMKCREGKMPADGTRWGPGFDEGYKPRGANSNEGTRDARRTGNREGR